jgi:hypothetical protein
MACDEWLQPGNRAADEKSVIEGRRMQDAGFASAPIQLSKNSEA